MQTLCIWMNISSVICWFWFHVKYLAGGGSEQVVPEKEGWTYVTVPDYEGGCHTNSIVINDTFTSYISSNFLFPVTIAQKYKLMTTSNRIRQIFSLYSTTSICQVQSKCCGDKHLSKPLCLINSNIWIILQPDNNWRASPEIYKNVHLTSNFFK